MQTKLIKNKHIKVTNLHDFLMVLSGIIGYRGRGHTQLALKKVWVSVKGVKHILTFSHIHAGIHVDNGRYVNWLYVGPLKMLMKASGDYFTCLGISLHIHGISHTECLFQVTVDMWNKLWKTSYKRQNTFPDLLLFWTEAGTSVFVATVRQKCVAACYAATLAWAHLISQVLV